MVAGQGVAAPPADPHWTAHPPESRGSSWLRLFTHKTVQPVKKRGTYLLYLLYILFIVLSR